MNEEIRIIYRDPTIEEIQNIINKVKEKMRQDNISKTTLSKEIDVNYPNLISVLNGKLVSKPIINKLNEWLYGKE